MPCRKTYGGGGCPAPLSLCICGSALPQPPEMTGRISIRSSSLSSSSSVTRSSPRTTRTLSGRRFSSFSTSLTRRGPLTSTSRTGWFSMTFISPTLPRRAKTRPFPLYLRVPQERRGFLRRNGVDIEAGAPLEAGDLRELGHDLDVPVVELAGPLVQRRGVQDEVERRRAQSPVQPAQRVRKEPRKRFELELLALLEVGGVPLGQHPHLEREPRGEGRDGEELGVLAHDPAPVADLLMDDVAVNAAFLILIVFTAAGDLVHHGGRDDGQRDQLRVRVLQRGPGGRAVVLEDQDVAEPGVFPQVQDAVAVRPEDVLKLLLRQARQRRLVIGRFDDHLVGAHPVHAIVEPNPLAPEIALDLQRRELVRDHAQAPPRRVGRATGGTVREDLRRRLRFVPRTERAQRLGRNRRHHLTEIGRALGSFGGDDHPPTDDRITP